MAFSAKLIVVVVAALFAQVLCDTVSIDDMITNSRAALDKIAEDFTKITGSSPEELKTALEARSQELQARAQSVIEEVKKQVEEHGSELPDKTKEAFNNIVVHLNQTIDHLKSQAPATLNEMSAVQAQFNEGFKSSMETFLEETKKLAKAAGDETGEVHDQVANFARDALTKGLDLINTLKTQVEHAVEQATAH